VFNELITMHEEWVVSFTPRPLYPGKIAPGTHYIGGWVRSASNYSLKMKQIMLLVGINDGVAYVPLNPSSKMKALESKGKGRTRHKA
jgi:hypothetical protein